MSGAFDLQPLDPPAQHEPGPFGRILCAVDGGPASGEVALRALALAGPDTSLSFLSVCDGRGYAATRAASLGAASARRALDEAQWIARTRGIRAQSDLRHEADAGAAIIAAARDHDLLVLGGGGRLVERAVAHSTAPVLVARAVPPGAEFPRDMLVATDGSAAARPVVALAGTLAVRSGARAVLLHVGRGVAATRRELAEQATMLIEATGSEPVTLRLDGRPRHEIVRLAIELPAALVVTGSRRPAGPALDSVSRHLALRATTSVLVLPLTVLP